MAPWLPDRLPEAADFAWSAPLAAQGPAGVAATADVVVVADRDLADRNDVFRGLSAEDGGELWAVRYPAAGELDYGNSPRATPLIHEGLAYLLGAHGHLHCVEVESGEILWRRDLVNDFRVTPPTWGYCSSPLIADGRLVVNPGAADASLVALDPETGDVLWKSPGRPPGYASFILAELGGRRQVVGYDAESLGGWDPATGRRLWELVPPHGGDFNVPTPVVLGGRLLVSTENNGTRLYDFAEDGTIVPEPVASNETLAPDSSTPVVLGGRVYGCWSGLHALDADDLQPAWSAADQPYQGYASLIAAPGRLLVTGEDGDLLLVDATADEHRLLSRLPLFPERTQILSHPALAGRRLYVRGAASVVCLELAEDE